MFAGAMMLLQLGGQYDGDFERNPYGEQYASRKWLDDHMLSFCKAGSESSGTTKQCIGAAGCPLAAIQLAALPDSSAASCYSAGSAVQTGDKQPQSYVFVGRLAPISTPRKACMSPRDNLSRCQRGLCYGRGARHLSLTRERISRPQLRLSHKCETRGEPWEWQDLRPKPKILNPKPCELELTPDPRAPIEQRSG